MHGDSTKLARWLLETEGDDVDWSAPSDEQLNSRVDPYSGDREKPGELLLALGFISLSPTDEEPRDFGIRVGPYEIDVYLYNYVWRHAATITVAYTPNDDRYDVLCNIAYRVTRKRYREQTDAERRRNRLDNDVVQDTLKVFRLLQNHTARPGNPAEVMNQIATLKLIGIKELQAPPAPLVESAEEQEPDWAEPSDEELGNRTYAVYANLDQYFYQQGYTTTKGPASYMKTHVQHVGPNWLLRVTTIEKPSGTHEGLPSWNGWELNIGAYFKVGNSTTYVPQFFLNYGSDTVKSGERGQEKFDERLQWLRQDLDKLVGILKEYRHNTGYPILREDGKFHVPMTLSSYYLGA